MAMEQPDARVVALEAHDDMAVGSDEQGVAPHGPARELDGAVEHKRGVVVAGIVVAAHNGLEHVAVQMERVFAGVLVIEHNLDHLVVAQHVRVRVGPVHGCVSGQVAGRQRRV